MQEGDSELGFVNQEWADAMFEAYSQLHNALEYLDEAERLA